MSRPSLLDEFEIAQLAGAAREASRRIHGGNSVVSATELHGVTVAVKEYRQRSDTWARMEREWRALELLASLGTELAPAPLGISLDQQIVVQSWIEGEVPSAYADPTMLISLLTRLSRLAGTPESAGISAAADAINSPLDLLHQTTSRCESLVESSVAHDQARALLSRCLEVQQHVHEVKWIPTLSPSDFGPHNILVSQGGVWIIDLEFFGWDDPHKLIADTLLHPLVTWTPELRDVFLRDATSLFGLHERRFRQVYAFAQAKWAAIVLGRAVREAGAARQEGTINALDLAERYFAGFESSVADLN